MAADDEDYDYRRDAMLSDNQRDYDDVWDAEQADRKRLVKPVYERLCKIHVLDPRSMEDAMLPLDEMIALLPASDKQWLEDL